MPQDHDLLDFEAPITMGSYERFLNYIESKHSLLKILGAVLFNSLSTLIICYKAGHSEDALIEMLTVAGGMYILVTAMSWFLHIFIMISAAIIDAITAYNPKIRILGALSISFLLSLVIFIIFCILAIFID